MTRQTELVLYNSAISGNAYKVRLLLSHLGLPFRRIEFDVDDGSTRTADFLARNPNGKVPTIAPARRLLSLRIQRDPLLLRRGHEILAGQQARPRGRAAMDVLRAIQPRALYRRGPPLGRASGQDAARTSRNCAMRTERGYHALGVMESRLQGPRLTSRARPIRSPTSRSTPTPTSRMKAASTSGAIPASAPGCSGWPRSPATSASPIV